MATTFATFDPTPYQRTPRLSIEGAIALGRALMNARPEKPPAHVARAADRLEALIAEGEAALTVRRREQAPIDASDDVAFDTAVDGLWGALRDRLSAWTVFAQAPIESLAGPKARKSAATVELARARKKAEHARALLAKLFGAEGLVFTRQPWAEQAESMAAILRLVEEDELGDAIAELAGSEWLATLHLCQAKYEAMVQTRASRDARLTHDLGELLAKIQRAITRYNTAILTLLDEDDPPSLDLVLAALRPVDITRARIGTSGRTASEPTEPAPVTTPSASTPSTSVDSLEPN